MAVPFLETKLFAPRHRPRTVARPRLEALIRRGAESRLTLVAAPAGFGKSTLIAEHLAPGAAGATASAAAASAAWLSLDQGDDDPIVFWSYVVAALQTAVPSIGEDALALLEAPPVRFDALVTALINDVLGLDAELTLVLDDYHAITSPEIHRTVGLLIDRLPPRMHLVISTRADPPLPLARLRATGELTEIRAADLRFTHEEAAAYLDGTMGLSVSERDVQALEQRTEGWIAALQLAALSMQGRSDLSGFIAGFSGDDRYVVDYLAEEVLGRQSEEVRRFLLRTSILSRLTGSLCDALSGGRDGGATLASLDRANLFLVPLDDQRRWYRYHHLFADVLRARLEDEGADEVRALHGQASAWFAEHGDRPEAIRHAIAAGDTGRAADLIELALRDMNRARQEATLRRWLELLPRDLFATRPVLAVGYVGALMSTGTTEGVETLIAGVERWLAAARPGGEPAAGPSPDAVITDQRELDLLPGIVALHRSGLARLQGDLARTIEHAERALAVAEPGDLLTRGGAAALLGLAHWSNGDLDLAWQWFSDGMASLDRVGHAADVVGGAVTLGDLRIEQGRSREAMRTYERGLERATRDAGPPLRGAADMHVGIAALLLEGDQRAAAAERLRQGQELGDENGMPQNPHRSRVVAAGLRWADGDPEAALRLLDDAERRYTGDFSPDVRPIAARRARLWIRLGRLADGWAWARERQLDVSDEPTYMREYEHATLARLLIADGEARGADGSEAIRDALRLLGRLVTAAEAGGRTGSTIDLLVATALAHHALGEAAAALEALGRAADLGEPEGYVRTFLDEGAPMIELLRLGGRQRDASASVRRLADAAVVPSAGPAGRANQIGQALVEPLSERELDVLRLLGSELDGPEMASHLFVSVNTLRTHTKSIYAKLGVNSRRAAVRRAAELGLLGSEPQGRAGR